MCVRNGLIPLLVAASTAHELYQSQLGLAESKHPNNLVSGSRSIESESAFWLPFRTRTTTVHPVI